MTEMGHEQTNRRRQRIVRFSSLNRLQNVAKIASEKGLRDHIFAATYRLADLEAFELRMVEAHPNSHSVWNTLGSPKLRSARAAAVPSATADGDCSKSM